jgi:PBP1b-binding outer membrane lipoprotein LpoB
MKMFKKHHITFSILILLIFFSGCASTSKKAFEMDESQVKTRSIQTRAFDTTDKKMMMQTVIGAMQDLDFVISKADLILGAVTGSKHLGRSSVKMTVTVRPRGEKQLLVRANAQYGIKTVEDPETYQDFFNTLGKALFLTAHQVD